MVRTSLGTTGLDDLSTELKNKTGCYVGEVSFNHFIFSDDNC